MRTTIQIYSAHIVFIVSSKQTKNDYVHFDIFKYLEKALLYDSQVYDSDQFSWFVKTSEINILDFQSSFCYITYILTSSLSPSYLDFM
jgi:hypothetical protein